MRGFAGCTGSELSLSLWGQHSSGELRICRTVTTPVRNWGKSTKEDALHCQRRRTKNDLVAEFPREQGKLQWMRHSLGISMSEAGQAK